MLGWGYTLTNTQRGEVLTSFLFLESAVFSNCLGDSTFDSNYILYLSALSTELQIFFGKEIDRGEVVFSKSTGILEQVERRFSRDEKSEAY